MNTFEALNLIALKGAIQPDAESNLRYVMRWYSKLFHTPLHVVMQEVPIEDVWLAFYEERYSGLKRDDLDEFIALALETPDERATRLDAEDAEVNADKAFAAMAEAAAVKPTALKVNANPADLLSQVPSLVETAVDAPMEPLEPDIEMTFVDPSEMEALLEGSTTGQATKQTVDPSSFR